MKAITNIYPISQVANIELYDNPAPFYQLDLSKPVTSLQTIDTFQVFHTPVIINIAVPFSQFDWSKPQPFKLYLASIASDNTYINAYPNPITFTKFDRIRIYSFRYIVPQVQYMNSNIYINRIPFDKFD